MQSRHTGAWKTIRALVLLSLFFFGAVPSAGAQTDKGVSPSLLAAIQFAVQSQEANPAFQTYYNVLNLRQSGKWGLAEAEQIRKDTGEVVPADFSRILAHQIGSDHWQVILPEAGNSYQDLLTQFPETLLDRRTKTYIREGFVASAVSLYSGHYLPWTLGDAATVYQNYNTHGEGQLDFGFSGSIRTTKSGTLMFAYDAHTWSKCTGKPFDYCSTNYPKAWYYNNTVVIKHADGEYSAFLHLQTGSIPDEILANCNNGSGGTCSPVTIPAGTIIGAVGSIGYSNGPHLHYETGDYVYGRCNYADVYDEDGDGDTSETNICTGGITGGHRISTDFYEKPYTATNCGTGDGEDPSLCMLYFPTNRNLTSQNPGTEPYTFQDVTPGYWAWSYVERLYSAGITGGCSSSPLKYCPESKVTRAQMAVFLLRGIHGASYTPPDVAGDSGFADVPPDYWSAAWIKELAAEGITGGCGNGNFCPNVAVSRDQMAVFLLRSKYGSAYSPPETGDTTGFDDVPTDQWAAAWIKQLVTEGITAGCGSSSYCPGVAVTRAQMAVFLVRTFNLP